MVILTLKGYNDVYIGRGSPKNPKGLILPNSPVLKFMS